MQTEPYAAFEMVKRRTVWGGHLSEESDNLMVQFCAGRDVSAIGMADEGLLRFDLWLNRVHAAGLRKIGALPQEHLQPILAALLELEEAFLQGKYRLDAALEDVHVNVEHWVNQKAGEAAGGWLHTARSRNDQAACGMRMYLRHHLLEFGQQLSGLAELLIEQASQHTETVMPGFTHHQPAMLTTWGHWLCAHAQALQRDLERLLLTINLINRNPLGAGAGFGSTWPLNREYTSQLLGFSAVEVNSLDAISSRGEAETQTAVVYAQAMRHLAVLSQDLLLLSHPYWNMLKLSDAWVTGSSIMPQKRNPDFAEVCKAKAAWTASQIATLMNISCNNMSGYHRDSQWSKYIAMDLVRECQPTPLILKQALKKTSPNADVMLNASQKGFLTAVDFANQLSQLSKIPFRSAYHITAQAVALSQPAQTIQPQAAEKALQQANLQPELTQQLLAHLHQPLKLLHQRNHSGSPAPTQVKNHIQSLTQQNQQQFQLLQTQQQHLLKLEEDARSLSGKTKL